MTKTLPLSEAKIKLSQLVDGILKREDEIIITRNGKPAAVLFSAEEYESWKETQEILANPELMREIRESLKEIQQGKTKAYTLDELFGPAA
ncbi:MAG: prevent-host-death protein [Candidatus Omnitrophica bacterium CG11_big_fil_rev_8_21_14_0_20_64_10]|nr:MAG: prevent-host-death protein [Candidatus Omnitrophica bacterium CG11_big_fil_rev_8_21_14_0_20_64_10]